MAIRDEALAGRVRNALIQDKRVGGQAIAVRAVDGEVLLKGIVDAGEQKELAVLVAGGIPGVRSVNTDELRVREAAQE